MIKRTRIAIFGGTFNPIHLGHLRVAEEVRETLGLDKVVFVPAYIPPHKVEDALMPASMRTEMIRLAISGNPGFELSDIEIKRGGRSFTIDTVRELKSKDPDLSVSLIIGNDSFNDITTWCEYEDLFRLASFIVVHRPGYAIKKPAEVLPVELARKFWYDSDSERFVNSYGTTITYVPTTLYEISSSDIRRKAACGLSIRYLVPEALERYIIEKGLYRKKEKENT